jgi:membrane-associated protein
MNILSSLEQIFTNWGYPLIFITSLIESSPIGWITPGNYILATGGFFAKNSPHLTFAGVVITGTLGTWITLLLAYILGKKTGDWLINKLKQERNAQKAKHMLTHHDAAILTTSLMANITRFWIAYVAGTQKYPLHKFIFYSFSASLTWVSLWASIGFMAAGERQNLEKSLTRLGLLGWILPVLALALIYYFNKKEYKNFKEQKSEL